MVPKTDLDAQCGSSTRKIGRVHLCNDCISRAAKATGDYRLDEDTHGK